MQRIIMGVCILSLSISLTHAQSPEEISAEAKGREIAEEARRRDQGFGDTVTEITMQLMSVDGRVRERRLTWRTLEATGARDGDKSLTVFHEPRDIAGTAFLSYTHVDQLDDQWLYLPSLKRVKRIASANRSSAFMGSEFAYEDLLSDEVEKFDYRWLRDESCGDQDCFVVERRARDQDSGYSRQVVWFDREEYRPVMIEYYDRRDRHEKTLVFDEYRRHLDRFWRAHSLRMTNHLSGKTTVLSFADFRFQSGLSDQDFDPSALRRVR